MLVVGQRVDDVKPRRAGGELLEPLLRERADDDRIDPAFETARDVGDRLALSERDVRLQADGAAAELANADLERRPRPQRRFLEQHRDVAAAERARGRRLRAERAVRLEARRQLETALEVGGVEIEDREKVLPRCDRLQS